MKKVNFFVFLVLGVVIFSSCASKRGVQFYSGDKNNDVIASNVELASQKRLDLQSQILRLQRQRDVVVMGIDRDESRDIMRREAEVRRLEMELQRLAAPQRGESNLTEYEEKLAQLKSKKEELELIKNSSQVYERNVAPMDTKIQDLESMLLSLEMAETGALIANLEASTQDYVLGKNIDAIDYAIIRQARGKQDEQHCYQCLLINKMNREITVRVVYNRDSRIRMTFVLAPNTENEVCLPYVGDYTVFEELGTKQINIGPSPRVQKNNKNYHYVFQRKW